MIELNQKIRIMCAAAALTLMVLPVSCGSNGRNNTTSNGVNENGIYDGSNDGNVLNRAGDVVGDVGDAIENGANRVENGLNDIGDDMTRDTTSTTYTTATVTTTTTTR